jgi:phosphoribosylaminoimidazole synthetase
VSLKIIDKEKSTYQKAGVNIDTGNKLIDIIKPLAKSTKRLGANTDLGGFGGLFDIGKCNFKNPILVSSTDGVGTKLKIATKLNIHDSIGIDLVAMCVNDIIVQGAEPLFFLDYFSSSKLSLETSAKVIEGVAKGCKIANCALIGGETAEMPGIYQDEEYDLAGFCVGAVEKEDILPKKDIKPGDVMIGLTSSGIHSNGFSLVRHILDINKINLNQKLSGRLLGEILLEPTKIYVESCLKAIKSGKIKALSHITGGGLVENIPRVLPQNLQAKIDYNAWKLPEIFAFLQEEGNVEDKEMRRVFNCGIGMVLIVESQNVDEILKILQNQGENPVVIGNISNK